MTAIVIYEAFLKIGENPLLIKGERSFIR